VLSPDEWAQQLVIDNLTAVGCAIKDIIAVRGFIISGITVRGSSQGEAGFQIDCCSISKNEGGD
jgi:hypothetical protein